MEDYRFNNCYYIYLSFIQSAVMGELNYRAIYSVMEFIFTYTGIFTLLNLN